MSYKQLPNGHYQVRNEISLTVFNERDARRFDELCQQAALEIRRKFEAGQKACPGIREGLPAFIEYQLTERGNDKQTVKRYRRRLLRWVEDLAPGGDIKVTEITREQVQAWLKTRLQESGRDGKYIDTPTLSREYVNGDLNVLKRFANWCYQQGFCEKDLPLHAVPPLRVPGKIKGQYRPRAISPERFKIVLAGIEAQAPHVHAVLQAMLLFGARPEALFLLDWNMIDMPTDKADGIARIPAVKGGLASEVRIPRGSTRHQLLLEARERWFRWHNKYPRRHEHKPVFCTRWGKSKVRPYGWTTSTFDTAVQRALTKAGIKERFTPYVARHSAITWLLRQGYKPVQIQHYAKHLDINTQSIYHWTIGSEAQEAYDEMEVILSA